MQQPQLQPEEYLKEELIMFELCCDFIVVSLLVMYMYCVVLFVCFVSVFLNTL